MGHDGIGILFIIGIGLFGGLLGARLFQLLRIPQVVGYIAIGVLCGVSGLQLIEPRDIETLGAFNTFALGIIGFLVGGELKLDIFRKYAKQFTAILLGEGVAAFTLVGVGVLILLYQVTGSWVPAIAGAAVFGAIASATDPASTINVLWEYRCKGVLTTSITAIVALDDALAMTLYGLGTATAQIVTGTADSIWPELSKVGIELGGAIAFGVIFAGLLAWVLRFFRDHDRTLAISLGSLLLLISLSARLHMDVILATMTLGFVLTNAAPVRSRDLFHLVRGFATPIYVMFFVLVGARLGLDNMPGWLWGIIGIYVVGRSVGKMGGTWLGARLTGAEPVVRKYLGAGLFAQGGVAVGLSILASQHLQNIPVTEALSLGDAIIFGVTATTLCVQLIGPPLVKWAAGRAQETGKDCTEEDMLSRWQVRDAMVEPDTIPEGMPVTQVVERFAQGSQDVYPVLASDGRFLGLIDIDSLRSVLAEQANWAWMLATDLVQQAPRQVNTNDNLAATLDGLYTAGSNVAPVLDQNDRYLGMLIMAHAKQLARHACLQG